MKNAFRNASNTFVALPDNVKTGITAVVLFLLAALFTNLLLLVPFLAFLIPFQVPIALAIAGALIGWIENAVPDTWGQVAVYAIQLVLAILAVFGVGQTLAAQGTMPGLLMLH